ncbi:10813_t:CDS:2, partial [Racocetra persica]
NDFKKTRDLTNHLNRKFKYKQLQISNPVQLSNLNVSRPQTPVPSSLSPIVHIHEKEATYLFIEDLANWLANPKIKNNPTIINKKIPKTDTEWDKSKDDPKDIDKKVSWPVLFPDDEMHQKKEEMYEAGMTEEHAKKILNAIDDDRFLIRVKFIWPNNDNFKIVDKYEPIRESKKASKKFVTGGPNVILTKKTNQAFGLELIENGALNCVAQRVIEHFEKAKRGHGLTSIRRQKIDTWEKRMRQPGAQVED